MWSAFKITFTPLELLISHHTQVQLSLVKNDSRHNLYSRLLLPLFYLNLQK